MGDTMEDERLVVERSTFSTRTKAEKLVEEAERKDLPILDFSEVTFVSRSFADELTAQLADSDVELEGLEDEVKRMFDLIQDENSSAKA